jgi:hypothetical protein
MRLAGLVGPSTLGFFLALALILGLACSTQATPTASPSPAPTSGHASAGALPLTPTPTCTATPIPAHTFPTTTPTPTLVPSPTYSTLTSISQIGFLAGDTDITTDHILDPDTNRWALVQGVPLCPKLPDDPSIKMAIIDSGVMKNHPQITGLIVGEKDFTGEGIEDKNGHGTLVALKALETNAKISEATKNDFSMPLLIAKVADKNGKIEERNVIEAIKWSVDNGAKVINLSLSFVGTLEDHQELCTTIASFEGHRNSPYFFVAAGNFGPLTTVYPASCPSRENMLVVGSTSPNSGKADVAADDSPPVLIPYTGK